MAFVSNLAKTARFFSTRVAVGKPEVQKAVFISQSNDVYTNLALEEWLSNNMDLKKVNVMLCYQNDPCVVVGKNGNPWLDVHTNGEKVAAKGEDVVTLARRHADAGIQYQDQGMMNFTFLGEGVTSGYNMGVMSRAIFRKYGVSIKDNGKNLSLYDMELTSNAENVNSTKTDNSYQNCTLFVDINKTNMQDVLGTDKATGNLLNLKEIAPKASASGLLSAIGWEYMRSFDDGNRIQDGGLELAQNQRGFQMVNPTDKWFPGLAAIRDRLVQWEWCFGSTPKFSIFRSFKVPQALLNNPSDSNELRVKLDVDNGKICDISLVVPPGLLTSGYTGEAQIITDIRGEKFSEQTLKKIERFLGLRKCHNEREKFVTECVKQAMVI